MNKNGFTFLQNKKANPLLEFKNSGFTLIELVIVISIMAILGLLFTGVLTQTLRGQNKIQAINQVKQNGQVVLDKLSNDIRQAESIDCINDDMFGHTDTIVLYKNSTYTRYRFYPPVPGISNGSIAWDNPGESDSCNEPQSIKNYITDPDPVKGVSLNYVSDNKFSSYDYSFYDPGYGWMIFKRSSLAGYNDTVTIKFVATSGVSSGQTYENMVAEGGVLFTTSVALRGAKDE